MQDSDRVSKLISIVLHGLEGTVALLVALYIAQTFPEHKTEALVFIFGMLSLIAKGARISETVPIPDYINPKQDLKQEIKKEEFKEELKEELKEDIKKEKKEKP